jgi:glutathione S-transferase
MNKFSVLTGVPGFTKGLVRELRVRWMHEELGLPYEEVRYPHPETKKEEYLKKQPFGQVPYFSSGDLCFFETGAILLHLALKHNKLLPTDEVERAHTLTWMFAAQTSMEPFFFHYFMLKNDPDASEASREKAQKIVKERLAAASKELGDKEFFGVGFSVAEIMMTTVLRTAQFQGFLADYKNLSQYLERNESRPAFQRALGEHVKLYEEKV